MSPLLDAVLAVPAAIGGTWWLVRIGLIESGKRSRHCESMRRTARLERDNDGRVMSASVVEHLIDCHRTPCRDLAQNLARDAIRLARQKADELTVLRDHLDTIDLAPGVAQEIEALMKRKAEEAAEIIEYTGSWTLTR